MSLLMAVANDAPAPPHRVVAGRAARPEPGRPALPRQAAGGSLRQLRRAGRGARAVRLGRRRRPRRWAGASSRASSTTWPSASLTVPIIVLLVMPAMAAPTWRQLLTHMAASLSLLLLYYGGSEALWARTAGQGAARPDARRRRRAPAAPGGRVRPRHCSSSRRTSCSASACWRLGAGTSRRMAAATPAGSTRSRPSASCCPRDALRRGAAPQRLRRPPRPGDGHARRRAPRARRGATGRRRTGTPLAAAPVVGARGPFAVLDGTIDGRPEWRPGLDERLRRPVWIRDVPVGTPPVAAARVALPRPTRLRWLAGRRDDAGGLGRLRRCRRRADRAGLPVAAAVVGGAALAGGPRARGRRAAARAISRRSISIASGSSTRAGPSCSTIRPPTPPPRPTVWPQRPRPAARGRASGARRRPPAVAGIGVALRRRTDRGPPAR